MECIAVHLVVRGTVQGVWYRESCRAEAERLGVAGTVRNRRDGTVEVHAEGPTDTVEALVRWCGVGPARATVTAVERIDVDPQGLSGFTVLR